jgi:hypothetical protein
MSLKLLQLNPGHVDHFKARRLVDGWSFGGERIETWFHDTPIGKMSASTTAMVLIEPLSADQACAILKPDKARTVARNLMHYAYLAEQRQRVINGETVRRVRIDGDSVTVTYAGETMPMRLQKTRKRKHGWTTCHECRARVDGEESWASYRITDKGWGPRPRVGEIRICKDCLPKLKVDNQVAPMLVEVALGAANEEPGK